MSETNNQKYCEYYLEHKGNRLIGDEHVFLYNCGEHLMCDKTKCPYGNQSANRVVLEGDNPPIGICSSKGLKVAGKQHLETQVQSA